MSWFGGAAPAAPAGAGARSSTPRSALNRQQQVDALRAANPYAVGVAGDPNSFDIGLKLPSGQVIRVRTSLPPGFPESGAPPTVRIVDTPIGHPWLDAQQRVVGSPELAGWAPSKNLGAVVLSIIQHFGTNPPVFGAAPAPAGPQGLMPGPYAGAASASSSSRQLPVGDQQAQQPAAAAGGASAAAAAADAANSTRHHTPVPPIPSAFPELQSLSLAELQALLDDRSSRREWVLDTQESLPVFRSLVVSTREEAAKAAQANMDAQADIAALRGTLRALQAANAAKADELKTLLAKRQAALERYAPSRLARDLQATADELDALSDSLVEQFCDPDNAAGPAGSSALGDSVSVYGGSGSGGGGWDDDRRSTFSGGTGAGGNAAALREFREELLALRRRYHMAHAKVELLHQGGLWAVAPPPAAGR
jgi:hypothetical protein